MKLIDSEFFLKQISENCFLIFNQHIVDFSEILSFSYNKKDSTDYCLGFSIHFKCNTALDLKFELIGDILNKFINEFKESNQNISLDDDISFDNFCEEYIMSFITLKLTPILHKIKSSKILNCHKSISIKSDSNDELYFISLNSDGSLLIEANSFAKVNNSILDKQISIELKNYNSFYVYRKPYLE